LAAGYLTANYILLFTMLSSLLVTLVRDPGKVKPLEELENQQNQNDISREDQVGEDNEDISLADALLSREPRDTAESFSLTPVKRNGESRWCRKVRMSLVTRGHPDSVSELLCSAGLPNQKGHITAVNVTDVCLKWVRYY
jgi:hypothetical protein